VVLEALACGLPVITSQYNGASELYRVPSEGFILDDPHEHAQLSWYMTLLLDPHRRTSAAGAARQRASRWTFDEHYRCMLAVFAEARARKQAA
jgi:UDP-glucose:(heptosyl)LPS alpha-1,3-glucosyltransferase